MVVTRSWGEDDWDDWDDDDWLWDDEEDDYDIEHDNWDLGIIDEWINNGGEVFEIGDSWIFVDENGDWFLMEDSDDNGYPDSVVITPDPEPIEDSEDPEYVIRYDDMEENGDSGGDYDSDDDGEPENVKTPFEKNKEKFDKVAKKDIGKRKFSIKEGTLQGNDIAVGKPVGSTKMDDILYKNIEYVVTIKPGLTDIQLQLVMAHEYVHIILFEKSREAGNAAEFEKNNKELYDDIKNAKNVNNGHHEYMGSHTDIMENLLKGAFPGQSDDFYNYGKWAGGATNSSTFQNLPKEEQKPVLEFLRSNKL